ncbi:LytR/AlgR family response regulator transcription factor [Pedobacter insulae]|uniref:LytTr DNA-binding domain-containing protein n=1 Tax=Pedobacter insulae TaxID=414048 RepID=A0A1I2ZIU8_9SPHI|nr:LytTR family DNA-binding domain-containing protein [Pedobacter insulae]SFH37575.1 LytTr DNA-binding domain-containing protein [Pedobacter insulae]
MQDSSSQLLIINYRDLIFRLIVCLIGAHIIILTGEDISTLKAFTIKSYYPVLAINYAIALILAWIVRRITIKLDRHFSWEVNLWLRFLMQFLFGIILVSLACFILVFIYFRSFDRSIMESDYMVYQFPLSIALIALLNSFYVIYYFYHRVKFLAATVTSNEQSYRSYIAVLDGKQTISLPCEEIAYAYIIGREVLIRTWDKKDYLCDPNLDELEGHLDPNKFFRINRRLIAHRSACQSYQPLEYGKLKIELVPVPIEDVTVSQRKAGAFKQWIQ